MKYIKKSALDISWTDEVTEKRRTVFIILEGILMYFKEIEVIQLFAMLKNRFPQCTILAEIMNPFIATQTKYHDTVKTCCKAADHKKINNKIVKLQMKA